MNWRKGGRSQQRTSCNVPRPSLNPGQLCTGRTPPCPALADKSPRNMRSSWPVPRRADGSLQSASDTLS
eukprot:4588352-Prymnesium_polylepis.1